MDKIPCTGNDATGNQYSVTGGIRLRKDAHNMVLVAIYIKKSQNYNKKFKNFIKFHNFQKKIKMIKFSKSLHEISKF